LDVGWRVRLAAAIVFALAACASGGATAADYPARPVRLVVGFAAGGPTDILTRILAERLSQRSGQQFIVENRTGASSNVAVEAVLNAPRDGYTILVMSTANAINTTFRPTQAFNVLRDLTPVAGLARITYVVALNPAVPVRNIAELVAYAKAHPGALNCASAGISSSNNLAAALFAAMTGIELTHIQYSGNAAAYPDLLSGRVQLIFADPASALQYVKSGGLRGLAVTSQARNAELPDLPPIAESVPGYEAYAWYGLATPRGTPPDVVETLNRAVNASLADPAIKARFAALGAEAMTFTPAEFGAFLTSETARWGEVVKAAGLKPE
jgi:tripartite-type tricarboxylate transporter receptor subunit TctC